MYVCERILCACCTEMWISSGGWKIEKGIFIEYPHDSILGQLFNLCFNHNHL